MLFKDFKIIALEKLIRCCGAIIGGFYFKNISFLFYWLLFLLSFCCVDIAVLKRFYFVWFIC